MHTAVSHEMIFYLRFTRSQIAIHLDHESYGFIFGINMFVALLLQTVFTAIVNTGLGLDTRMQVSFLYRKCRNFRRILTLVGKQHLRKLNPLKFVHMKN